MNLFLLRSNYEDGDWAVQTPDIKDPWDLDEGTPRAASMGEPVTCFFDPMYPTGIRKTDLLHGSNLPIVSLQAKNFLESTITAPVEFLPVRVIDHFEKEVASDYFILHPLQVISCINTQASGVTWNLIDPTIASGFAGVVTDTSRVPADCDIFRPKHTSHNIILRNDLVTKLSASGLTGLAFLPFSGYTGIE